METTLSLDDLWKRPGFMRHCGEYWILASLIIHHFEESRTDALNPPARVSGVEKYDDANIIEVSELVQGMYEMRI